MKIILLDTNMLMGIGMLKIDIFSEIERICNFPHENATFDSNVQELQKIEARGEAKFRKAAKLALQLLHHKKVKILKSGIMPADEAIMQSLDGNYIVATQDAVLKKRLKARNVPIIVIRQKKYLKFG